MPCFNTGKWYRRQIDIHVGVDPNEVGKAIGKEGRNVKLMKDIEKAIGSLKGITILSMAENAIILGKPSVTSTSFTPAKWKVLMVI